MKKQNRRNVADMKGSPECVVQMVVHFGYWVAVTRVRTLSLHTYQSILDRAIPEFCSIALDQHR